MVQETAENKMSISRVEFNLGRKHRIHNLLDTATLAAAGNPSPIAIRSSSLYIFRCFFPSRSQPSRLSVIDPAMPCSLSTAGETDGREGGGCNIDDGRVGEADSGGGVHVLAVDDSSVDRAVITGILKSSKLRVTAVDSGKTALELLGLEKKKVSLIITDYWMPEMTGYELLRRVKESSELKEIPVVIVSSENVPNRIIRCLEEGAEDFLLKPVRPSDVSRLCSRVLK